MIIIIIGVAVVNKYDPNLKQIIIIITIIFLYSIKTH